MPQKNHRRSHIDGYQMGSGQRLTLLKRGLGLRVAGELAGCSVPGETLAASCPTAIDDRATILGGHAGQKSELADTTFLGGLERSFHGKC